MGHRKKVEIGFLPTFVIIFISLAIILIGDSKIWGIEWKIKLISFVIGMIIVALYLFWRCFLTHGKLIKTGLEWGIAACILAIISSWILSPDPRQGLSRISIWLTYFLLFYIVLDALDAGLNRNGVMSAVFVISGLVLFFTALEIYVVYFQWWGNVGSWKIMPPFPYRFVSLIGHSNSLMGFVNLCAPLVVVYFVQTKKMIKRILSAFWLISFLIIIPFSSSRGGWLGIICWAGLLMIYWVSRHFPVIRWNALSPQKKQLIYAIAFISIIIIGIIGYGLFYTFAQHPSHGTNIFGGRGQIWSNAIKIWISNVWFGAGPGRFGVAYLSFAPETPPGFWALHAHSLIFELFAEFGAFGVLSFGYLFLICTKWVREIFSTIDETKKYFAIALLAGVLSLMIQMIVDDQSNVVLVMVTLIIIFSLFISLPNEPLQRWRQVNNEIIVIPIIIIMLFSGWNIWAYQPFSTGIKNFKLNADQSIVDKSMVEVLKRDPNSSFYPTQAGYMYGTLGLNTHSEKYLELSYQHFEESLAIEPSISLFYANMAIVAWNSSKYHDFAIPNMTHAINISPNEASYYLNLGWFYEKEDKQNEAIANYLRVLRLKPNWSNHPFWLTSEIRQRALSSWVLTNGIYEQDENNYWSKAREEINNGELSAATLTLAKAEWVGEPKIAIDIVKSLFAEKQNNRTDMINNYERVVASQNLTNLDSSHQFMFTYTIWMNQKDGFTDDLLPGYIQLTTDYGQFDVMEKLYTLYIDSQECEKAENIWQIWHYSILGGAYEPIPATPACISDSK